MVCSIWCHQRVNTLMIMLFHCSVVISISDVLGLEDCVVYLTKPDSVWGDPDSRRKVVSSLIQLQVLPNLWLSFATGEAMSYSGVRVDVTMCNRCK